MPVKRTEQNLSVNERKSSASARMQEVRRELRGVRDAFRRTDELCSRAEDYRKMAVHRPCQMRTRSEAEACVQALLATHSELQEEIERLLERSRRMERRILTLPDTRHRAVLQLRYLCAMDWEEVAAKLHYTLRWTHKLHREAVGLLAAKEDAE